MLFSFRRHLNAGQMLRVILIAGVATLVVMRFPGLKPLCRTTVPPLQAAQTKPDDHSGLSRDPLSRRQGLG